MFATQNDKVSRGLRQPLASNHAEPQHEEMPDHWKSHFEGNRFYAIILESIFKVLCVLSFGSRTLDDLWSKVGNAERYSQEFLDYKDRIINKMNTVTVVVSTHDHFTIH